MKCCGNTEIKGNIPELEIAPVLVEPTDRNYWDHLNFTKPPVVDWPHGEPLVHPDGCIEYIGSGVMPDIEGYERVGDRKFRPLWPICRARLGGMAYSKGYVQVLMVCNHRECPKHMSRVSVSDCEGCPFRKAEL